ncbi:transcriptional regulator, XRE family [Sphingobium sp. AP50]|uniref:helix-turn-helix domain-containing protein n=1 Tax=Sphingobium sp. AP50 TaxID=1884369 RepID=UPI0008BCE2EB|nr:helix-turn-helix transcriptional regulator [Sphingobium sp. AP50]SEK02263.1 transcriptional regulator, XRE family [Sphingobium sp. AP50]
MSSLKSKSALARLGQDIRAARLRRNMARADLAVRTGTSASTIGRLESGDPGVGIGMLADVLVALGLIDRLADLVDVRHDELGLAMAAEKLPQRGRTFAATVRRQQRKSEKQSASRGLDVNPDGVAF